MIKNLQMTGIYKKFKIQNLIDLKQILGYGEENFQSRPRIPIYSLTHHENH